MGRKHKADELDSGQVIDTKSKNKKAPTNVNINSWRPKNANELFVNQDGKLFVCYFDQLFRQPKLRCYNRFFIGKSSYENQLSSIVNYINYFLNYYDHDMELPTAYLKIKFILDKLKKYDEASMDGFIDLIYEVIFTPTMIDKIHRLVDDNYLDDIESSDGDKKSYLKSDKKHLESLEFTNQHIRLLLSISFGMKIMCPVMFHYIRLNNINIGKESPVIFQFYKKLFFDIFRYGDDFDIHDAETEDLIKDEVPRDQVLEHIKAEHLTKIDEGYTCRYYYQDNESGRRRYYTPTAINMYNKLYSYVINAFAYAKLL